MKTLISRLLFFVRWPVWYELEVRKNLNLTDIGAELQRRALAEAADFVSLHLAGVDSFDNKVDVLSHALDAIDDRKGLYLEFGVFKGGTINHIAGQVEGPVYGFDSFEGLPERWNDNMGRGSFKVANLPKVRENVELIQGWFDKTLPEFLSKHLSDRGRFVSFVHIDSDIYSSAKTIFSCLTPLIKAGTVIVFDEYFNYPEWKDGEYKAFNEFIAQTGHTYEYLSYNRKGHQVSMRILK